MSSLKEKLNNISASDLVASDKNINKGKNKNGESGKEHFYNSLSSITQKIKNTFNPTKYKRNRSGPILTNTLAKTDATDFQEAQLLSEKTARSFAKTPNHKNPTSGGSEVESDMVSVNVNSNKDSDNSDYLKNVNLDQKINQSNLENANVNSFDDQANPNQQKAINILSLLLDIEQSARRAKTLDELRFIIVNRTYEMTPYDRCVLIEETPFGLKVGAVSNIPILNREAPFIIWLQQYIQKLEKKKLLIKPLVLKAEDQEELLKNKWLELTPPYLLIIPLTMYSAERPALLVMFSNQPWPENDFVLLNHLCEAYAFCINPLLHRRFIPAIQKRKRLIQTSLLVIFIIVCLIPVNQKALAPAEIAPFNPTYLSAPIDGIIKEVLVEPNTLVNKSQLVMTLDDSDLRSAFVIANSSFRIAEANLLRVTQEAFNKPSIKAEVALAQSKLEKARLELDFASELLARVNIYSPVNGTIIFRDKSDFIGQPIKIGQRLFLIADPNAIELSIELPVGNAIPLKNDAPLRFFVNSDPLNPIDGTLFYHSVRAEPNSSQVAVYKLRAKLDNSISLPRLGSRGTAHIYGSKTLFIFYVLRKPIGLVRQFLGL